MNNNKVRNNAIASLVLGIVSVILCWSGGSSFFGILAAIAGIVLGTGAVKQMQVLGDYQNKGLANAGVILSIIGLCLGCVVFIVCGIVMGTLHILSCGII